MTTGPNDKDDDEDLDLPDVDEELVEWDQRDLPNSETET
jgi:hypothetical protein